MKSISIKYFLLLLFASFFITSCGDDDPMPMEMEEEMEEEINQVKLTFTPDNGEDAIIAEWFDADGEGAAAPTIGGIQLEEGVNYELAIEVLNTLGSSPEDITAEIKEEADEHMFFFSFTDGIFSNPTGNGNIDNRNDPLNYNDQDSNGQPLGLSTNWTAGAHTEAPGEFKIILKHQPDLKSATSDANTGGTDIDITFAIEIAEDEHGEEEEVINKIVLNFTPTAGGDAITAAWFDADGEGVANPTIDEIGLAANTEYTMTLTLENTLGMDVEDITAEISEEADEHMFFYGFTADIFSNPAGDGNIDNREDPLNYNDEDSNGNPVGLSTTWTTGAVTTASSDFRIVLKHQPDLKTATSDATVGGTDVDITLSLSIQ